MNGILWLSEDLLTTELTPAQRESLTLIKAAESLLAVVGGLFGSSHLKARTLQSEHIAFDLRDCVFRTIKSLSRAAERKNLALRFAINEEVPRMAVGDAGILRQILLNLLGNAIKFTERGEVSLRIDWVSKTAKEVVLHFVVTSTGVGIPPEKQQSIIDALTQPGSALSGTIEASAGSSLAVTAQLVRMMDGHMWDESEVDKGSAFHFTVRLGEMLRWQASPFSR